MNNLMKFVTGLALLAIFTTSSFAQETNNDLNGTRAMVKAQVFSGATTQGPNWIDENGDGICDNVGTDNQGQANSAGKGLGLKDGSGAKPSPQDGTGYGKKVGNKSTSGDGISDREGFGSQNSSGRKGKK